MNATLPKAVGVDIGEGSKDGQDEICLSVATSLVGAHGLQGVRASGIEAITHDNHSDDVDVNAKGHRDRSNHAKSAMGLILVFLIVPVGHDFCGFLTFCLSAASNFNIR